MKKLDLHIHTISTITDKPFEFSMKKLKEYVAEQKIDGIAITNHNIFDKEQFLDIQNELGDSCVVMPGIEIDLGIKYGGHIICITTQDDIDDFVQRCKLVSQKIENQNSFVKYKEFKEIFTDLGKYIWIPHYDKDPVLDEKIIKDMGSHIVCGEVGSVKKFIYNIKNSDSLTPVLFSDMRIMEELQKFPLRQTYFDIGEISVASIKAALLSKTRISLSEEEGNSLFYVLPNLKISTGLNVMIGSRSSGKTVTLNEINEANNNSKYIKQFSLIEQNEEKAAKEFTDKIATKSSSFAEDYLRHFKDAVSTVVSISIRNDEKMIEDYITSLIKFAKESDRADAFSKCALYNEELFPVRKLDNLEKLIGATETLLDTREYRELINRHIEHDVLVGLLLDLIKAYKQEHERLQKESWVNDIVRSIRNSLRQQSAMTTISEVSLYECALNRRKVEKFNALANIVMNEAIISNESIEDFTIIAKKRPFSGAKELKEFSGRKNVHFTEISAAYQNNPYEFLVGLAEMEDIPDSDYYKYFARIEYAVLNKYGYNVSGGERAEFNLLQEIKDAYTYDLLLIDEPESSFDNIFLKEKVNHMIKELSKTMPVIIVTHNNTVGESIKPDFIIHTKRITDGEVRYERYCGFPSDKFLVSSSGEKINNIDAIMDCLEAGQEAYEERRNDYEVLKH